MTEKIVKNSIFAKKMSNEIVDNSIPSVIIPSDGPKENPKCEYLSNDIIDIDYFRTFSSLYAIKYIVGANRVHARYLFISPLTLKQKVYTIVQTIATLAILLLLSEVLVTNNYVYEEVHCFVREMALLCGLNHINSIFYARFVYNESNKTFQLKMQKIDRLMGIARNKQINGFLSRVIRFHLTVVGALSATLLLISFFGGFHMSAIVAAIIWSASANILESTQCSVLLVYLLIRVRFINAVMLNHLEGAPGAEAEPPADGDAARTALARAVLPSRTVFRLIAAQAHDFRSMDTDIHLKLLFECFQDLEDLFKFPVAVLFISYFTVFWLCVQFIIIGLKYRVFNIVEWALPPILLYMGFVLTFALTYFFEMFFREVRETKRLAIVVMSRHHDDELWAKARRMQRLAGLRAPQFSVCGLWQLDAAFFMRFFQAVSAMIVTELQFRL